MTAPHDFGLRDARGLPNNVKICKKVVEDVPDLAQLIVRELLAARHEVVFADNGISALEQHASQRPDPVILDWMLPEMDGLEFLRRLR